jgi:hypothetical protein
MNMVANKRGRRVGKRASRKTVVAKVTRERKRGTLRPGRSGAKVTSQKQAIAIGVSEGRRAGAKVSKRRRPARRRRAVARRRASS